MQRWATYLAPGVRPLYELIVARVRRELGVEAAIHARADYSEIGAGEHDFVFVCGLPYVELVDGLLCALEPVAAPVLVGDRHGGRPVYFSDVVVPVASRARSFADLRGVRWAYNETGSHSGYLVTLHHLARMGEDTGFFREWVDARFHEEALRMVADGRADASAIDSQVLAVALDTDPALAAAVRVVDSFGPSPSQPLVAAPHVPDEVRAAVAVAALAVGGTAEERVVLAAMHVERMAAVVDSDYDEIRRMLAQVEMAGLWTAPRPAGLATTGA